MALVLLKRLDLVYQEVDQFIFGGKFLQNISSTLFKFGDFGFFLLQTELDFPELFNANSVRHRRGSKRSG